MTTLDHFFGPPGQKKVRPHLQVKVARNRVACATQAGLAIAFQRFPARDVENATGRHREITSMLVSACGVSYVQV